MMRRAIAALLACVWLVSAGTRALAQPAMWTVHAPHATLVLFGSVHLLPHGVAWEPKGLSDALAQANEIWFELPINSTTDEKAQALVAQKGALPAGDSLFAHLTESQAARLRAACARLGVAPERLANMRPWMADVTLSVAQDVEAGASPAEGVEQQISQQLPASVLRRAFETPDQQINFLAAAPVTDQMASLDETLSEITDDPDLFRRVVAAWMAGDLASLDKEVLTPLERTSPDMFGRLIANRNRRWATILARRLKGEGNIVVIVGMGHLLGPQGVPALLRERGLTVDGPELPPH